MGIAICAPSSAIPIIIQARLSSSRLPGKVLLPLAGHPLIDWLVDALRHCALPLILATSEEPDDTPLAAHGESLGLRIFRGSRDNVRARLLEAAGQVVAFVRICADSPMLDHRLVSQAVTLYQAQCRPVDLVTNVFPRSHPKGQSVEVVTTASLARLAALAADPDQCEHATKGFYDQPDRWRIVNVAAPSALHQPGLCVDTPADHARLEGYLSVLAADGAIADRPYREHLAALGLLSETAS